MVKLSDVARHAGVGAGTASRALSGKGYVDPGTRAKVEASARDLGYRPNAVARALREQRTGVIGLALPDIHNEFYTASAAVLQTVLADAGLQLLVASTRNDGYVEAEVLHAMVDRRVDGVVHVPVGSAPDDFGVPRVELNRRSGADVVSVLSDDQAGIAELTRRILAAGHRDLAVLSGPSIFSTSRERLAGFRAAVADVHDVRVREVEAPYSVEGGAAAMSDLLDDLPHVVIVLSSRLLLGVLGVCGEQGLKVPHRVGIAAFGDPDWYTVWQPPITTFAPPLEEMGRRAARELLALLGGEHEAAPGPVYLPGDIRVRGSVKGL